VSTTIPGSDHMGSLQDSKMDEVIQVTLGVSLRPINETLVPWMFALETDPAVIWRFRLGGITPSFDQYKRFMFANILDQAVIVDSQDEDKKIGFVYADKFDFANGTAEIGLVASSESKGSGLILHGMLLFIDRLFRQYPIRKLVGEMLEFNAVQFAAKEGPEDFSLLVRFESKCPSYYYLAGRYWDRYQIGIFREDWIAHRGQMIASALRRMERCTSGQEVDEKSAQFAEALVRLDSDNFALRAVGLADRSWCMTLVQSATASRSLRYPHAYMGPTDVERQLWAGVVCQFIAEDRANNIPVALLTAFDFGSANLVGSVHALVAPEFVRLPVYHEALLLFTEYVFSCWPLRMLYLSYVSGAPELEAWRQAFQVGNAPSWERVALQKEQVNRSGELVDRETWVLDREHWNRIRPQYLPATPKSPVESSG